MMTKTAIIIPSRLASTRLLRKPLIEIESKPMIILCAERATEANCGDVFIACDGDELAEVCEKYGYKYVTTDPAIQTGSDRVYVASKMLGKEYDFLVNLQGDMPKIQPETIKITLESLINDKEGRFDIMSAIGHFSDEDERKDINNVRAIVAHGGNDEFKPGDVVKSLYFTRTPEIFPKSVYKHHGIYAYRAPALEKFVSLNQTRLELEERLEQLRALENNMTLGCVFVEDHIVSVDTQKDLEKLLKM